MRLLLTLLLVLISFECFAQTNTVRLTTAHFKNEPVEIVEVKLDGVVIPRDSEFNASAGWTSRIQIKVKNVSEQPVSKIQVLAFVPVGSREETPFNTTWWSGAGLMLQPNDTTTLFNREEDTHGEASSTVVLQVQRVWWNGDMNRYWTSGKVVRKVGNKFVPEDEPQARYRLPLEYQKNRKAAYDPLPNCTEHYTNDYIEWCGSAQCPSAPGEPRCSLIGVQGLYSLTILSDIKPVATHLRCQECNGLQIFCPMSKSVNQSAACQPLPDPVIVDVLGNGFRLTDAQGGVAFDVAMLGRAYLVSWTAPESDDGFLALDRNHNGRIDDGSELFGNNTVQDGSWAPNGFKALAELDSDGDGQITSSDTLFGKLRVWVDTNHNGQSESTELFTLPSLNIEGFKLDYKASKRVDAYGNLFRYRTKVWGKKTGGWAYDVFLRLD